MKLKSAAGIVCYVKDVRKTVKFYETLGFTFKKNKPGHATGYINWFWIDFLQIDKEDKPGFRDEAKAKSKGAGQFLYLSVDNVETPTRAWSPRGSSRRPSRRIGRGATVSSSFAIPTATSSSSSSERSDEDRSGSNLTIVRDYGKIRRWRPSLSLCSRPHVWPSLSASDGRVSHCSLRSEECPWPKCSPRPRPRAAQAPSGP